MLISPWPLEVEQNLGLEASPLEDGRTEECDKHVLGQLRLFTFRGKLSLYRLCRKLSVYSLVRKLSFADRPDRQYRLCHF